STGPFNQHFLRDIGLIFLLLGGAFLVRVIRTKSRVVLWAAATLWLIGNALFHLWEVEVGMSPESVIPPDFPSLTAPGRIAIALTAWAWSTRSGSAPGV